MRRVAGTGLQGKKGKKGTEEFISGNINSPIGAIDFFVW
jgi:hypothetical protein